jgi:hypothetical protein
MTMATNPAEERLGKVGLRDDHASSGKEQGEAPEKEPVAGAGAGDADHLELPQGRPDHLADPLAEIVGALQRPSLPVDLDTPPEAPTQHAERHKSEGIHRQQRPHRLADIPIDFAGEFHILPHHFCRPAVLRQPPEGLRPL